MITHHEDTANEIHGEYRWRTFAPNDLSLTDGTAEEAAQAMGLDVHEVEWAVDEYGRCDTQYASEPGFGLVCWKPGPIEYGTSGDVFNGGYEWPAAEAPSEDQQTDALIRREDPPSNVKYIAYLMDNDTVAYGLGDVGTGNTKEEAIASLRSQWEAGFVEDNLDLNQAWDEMVEDGEAIIGWGTDKMRLFIKELSK